MSCCECVLMGKMLFEHLSMVNALGDFDVCHVCQHSAFMRTSVLHHRKSRKKILLSSKELFRATKYYDSNKVF